MSDTEQKQQPLQAHLSRVLQEMQEAAQGRTIRQELIRRIEGIDPISPRRLLIYVANIDHPASQLTAADIVPLGDALASLGKVDRLDVLLHTPGGSGDMAEKFIEMCRSHCSGQLRVIVPNMAKSAGTLIALGADAIVMGYCSELGPIDPQIQIIVGNKPQWVSAWTFIRTRDLLQAKAQDAIAKGENPAVYLQQLAGVDPIFVTHCEHMMTFARQLVRKFILARVHDQQVAEEQAKQVVDFLGNVEEHISHGRLITARELRQHSPSALFIIELPEDDALWQLLWEVYVRCEVFLKLPQAKAKVIETADVSITLA
jgi:membrane-bound ClpP family serine protease